VRILRAPWSPTLFDKTAFAGIAALSMDMMHNRQNRVIALSSSLHFRSQIHDRIQRISGRNLFIVVLICNSWNSFDMPGFIELVSAKLKWSTGLF
jgi:hypothetical protein